MRGDRERVNEEIKGLVQKEDEVQILLICQ